LKRPVFIAYLGGAGALVAVALAALGVGGPPAPKTVLLMSGHTFGLGEQQVYAIDRTADLTVRFRDATGTLRTKKYHHQLRNSVAFTIEGVSSGGHPVLAMVTANPVAASTSSPAAYPAAPAAPVSPPPSPELDEHGALAIAGDAADLAPASIILSAVTDDVLSGGRPWKSGGDIKLPYGTVSLAVVNTASPMPNDQTNSVVQIHSTGAVQFRGKLAVGGFGQASLRGAGSADGTSFVDTQHKLLLGLAVTSAVRGNALARNKHGNYDLKLQLAIKLVHYVPGIPPVPIGPGYILASGYVGSYASPDTGNYSTAPPNPIAVPAPTNTEYTGSPLPTYEPSALPEASLPPIPMPLPSGQPVASPPPGPTPTPTPTRY
jgi:hypothetical protein